MKRKYLIELEVDTDKADIDNIIRNKFKFDFGANIIDVENIKETKQRTSQQNRSLYLYFRLLAEELNNSGYDMRKTIKQEIDISWNEYTIKNYLWLPIMKATTGKTSTAKLDTAEIDKIYDLLNKTIAERTGVSVLFPSFDNMLIEQQ